MPIYRFQLKTPLSKNEVIARIQRIVRKKSGFLQSLKEFYSGRKGSAVFIGDVAEDSFHLYRNISYRNSFLPRVNGSLIATADGTEVLVRMHLHPVVAIFILFWLSAVGVGAFTAFYSEVGLPSLIPLGMFIFGIALTAIGFYPEALKARKLLEKALA